MEYCPECGSPVQQRVLRCGKCDAEVLLGAAAGGNRQTVVELVQSPGNGSELEKARRTAVEADACVGQPVGPSAEASESEQTRFRPIRRPPTALLVALDDGSHNSGEVWRVRRSRHVIGRASGDTVIPHDNDISAEHAEITCRWQDGSYRWHLIDLSSTNGTFLRVKKVVLGNEKQLLLGGRRYEFRAWSAIGPDRSGKSSPTARGPHATSKFQNVTPSLLQRFVPHLAELGPEGDVGEFELHVAEAWIGTDPAQCNIVVEGDPFVGAKCARIFRDNRNRWTIEDAGSLNGVWIRIQRIPLELNSEFQIGEQRFHFKVL